MVEEVVEEGEALFHYLVVEGVGSVFALVGEHGDAGGEEGYGDSGIVEYCLVPYPVKEHVCERGATIIVETHIH